MRAPCLLCTRDGVYSLVPPPAVCRSPMVTVEVKVTVVTVSMTVLVTAMVTMTVVVTVKVTMTAMVTVSLAFASLGG